MSKKTLLLTALVLAQPPLFYATASAEIEDVSAVWDQNREQLTVNAKDEHTRGSLSVVYNDQEFPMTYNRDRERYQLRLSNVCYDNTVSVVSSSGESKRKSVRTKNGDGSGYEC
ncbi:MAG: hypothetical protein KKH60_12005, partial [Proteobacteria bacterium]|nr:hypothetical protein [Pseudomonadota bacterium]